MFAVVVATLDVLCSRGPTEQGLYTNAAVVLFFPQVQSYWPVLTLCSVRNLWPFDMFCNSRFWRFLQSGTGFYTSAALEAVFNAFAVIDRFLYKLNVSGRFDNLCGRGLHKCSRIGHFFIVCAVGEQVSNKYTRSGCFLFTYLFSVGDRVLGKHSHSGRFWHFMGSRTGFYRSAAIFAVF